MNTHVIYVTRTASAINWIKLTLYGRRYISIIAQLESCSSSSSSIKIHFVWNIPKNTKVYNIKKVEQDDNKKIEIMRKNIERICTKEEKNKKENKDT